jgi:hypothetical protein
MVHASTHMKSVSLHGWASTRYRAIQLSHHVPFYLLPPDHHHLPDALCHSNKSQVTSFPNGNNSLGDSLASPEAPGAHLLLLQGDDEHQQLEFSNGNNNKALAEGSPLCPDDCISQDWMSSQVVPPPSPPVPSFLLPCFCRHQRGLNQQPSPFQLELISDLHQ